MYFNWTSKKWVTIALHLLFWTVVFSLPSLLRPTREKHSGPPEAPGFLYQYLINCATWIGLFYLNAYVLIPRFILTEKYKKYALFLIPVFVFLFLINWGTFALFIPERDFRFNGFVFFYIFPCLFFLACSTAWTMFRHKITSDRLSKEKETLNLKTELAFLRSQVSPHFMFNVLNNMVALARKKSDLLEPSLIKLSSLLRYMLYETDEEKVLLDKEVDYLKSYIDLQVQRFGNKIKVEACLQEVNGSYLVEPMLLIPFVENAFKHGTGAYNNGEINIKLTAKDNLLHFSVGNAYTKNIEEIKDKTSGIGLQNVKRRLNLLYNQMHTLTITDENNFYTIDLQLKLH